MSCGSEDVSHCKVASVLAPSVCPAAVGRPSFDVSKEFGGVTDGEAKFLHLHTFDLNEHLTINVLLNHRVTYGSVQSPINSI